MEESSDEFSTEYVIKYSGLVKKSISFMTKTGQKQHLVAYYTEEDMRNGVLKVPSECQEFFDVPVETNFYPKFSMNGIVFPPSHVKIAPNASPDVTLGQQKRRPEPQVGSVWSSSSHVLCFINRSHFLDTDVIITVYHQLPERPEIAYPPILHEYPVSEKSTAHPDVGQQIPDNVRLSPPFIARVSNQTVLLYL